jgi:hypothetical protein
METTTTNNLQATSTTRTISPGLIATRPIKPSTVQSAKKTGLNVSIKKLELEGLEVIVGNGGNLAPGVLKVRKGDTVYIKSDRYHQPWASEILKSKGLEEIIDGKEIPIEFILVPIGEVVMVDSVVIGPLIDWSKIPYWWPCNIPLQNPVYPPYYIGDPPTPPIPPYPPYGPPNIWCGNISCGDGKRSGGGLGAEYVDGTGIPSGGLPSGDTTG